MSATAPLQPMPLGIYKKKKKLEKSLYTSLKIPSVPTVDICVYTFGIHVCLFVSHDLSKCVSV